MSNMKASNQISKKSKIKTKKPQPTTQNKSVPKKSNLIDKSTSKSETSPKNLVGILEKQLQQEVDCQDDDKNNIEGGQGGRGIDANLTSINSSLVTKNSSKTINKKAVATPRTSRKKLEKNVTSSSEKISSKIPDEEVVNPPEPTDTVHPLEDDENDEIKKSEKIAFDEQLRKALKEAEEKAALEAKEAAENDFDIAKSLKDHDATGKYLHEEDLNWCSENTNLDQASIMKWFKRFRKASPKSNGRMNKKEFLQVFKRLYHGNGDVFTNEIFNLYELDSNSDCFDFKDFLVIIEVTTCPTIPDKLRWLSRLLDMKQTRRIHFLQFSHAITILDQLEFPIPEADFDKDLKINTSKMASSVAENSTTATGSGSERSPAERLEGLKKYLEDNYDGKDELTIDEFVGIPIRLISAYGF